MNLRMQTVLFYLVTLLLLVCVQLKLFFLNNQYVYYAMAEKSAIKNEAIQFLANNDIDSDIDGKLWKIIKEFEAKQQRNVLLTNCHVISNQNHYRDMTILSHLRELQEKDITMSDLLETRVGMHVDRLITHECIEIRKTAIDLCGKWESMAHDWVEHTFCNFNSEIDRRSKRPLEQSSVETVRLPSMKRMRQTSMAELCDEEDQDSTWSLEVMTPQSVTQEMVESAKLAVSKYRFKSNSLDA